MLQYKMSQIGRQSQWSLSITTVVITNKQNAWRIKIGARKRMCYWSF